MLRTLRQVWRAVRRQLIILLTAFLGYLLQVCAMPYFKVFGITPSLPIALIAIFTICFGKLRAFWIGALYGILFESMQTSVVLLQLMLYPVAAILTAVLFADKSQQQLEYERGTGRAGRNSSPLVRTVLCAAANAFIHELINIVYISLRGAELQRVNIFRGIAAVVLTTLLTAVLMFPVRKMFGFAIRPVRDDAPRPYQKA